MHLRVFKSLIIPTHKRASQYTQVWKELTSIAMATISRVLFFANALAAASATALVVGRDVTLTEKAVDVLAPRQMSPAADAEPIFVSYVHSMS